MKKTIFALVFIMFFAFGVFAQNSGPMDLVVLLDTSASMSNSYRETSDYLIGPFLREYLRLGDTFHLISFGTPKVEISRRIEAVGDVEAVIGRLLLMYPLDPQSDLTGALSFAESYSSSLPGSRTKKIVLITDGDISGTQSLVTDSANRLKSRGTDLQYIKVPVTGTGPSSGRPPAQTAQKVQPAASQPAQSGAQSGAPSTTAKAPAAQTAAQGQTSQAGGSPASGAQAQASQTGAGASGAQSQAAGTSSTASQPTQPAGAAAGAQQPQTGTGAASSAQVQTSQAGGSTASGGAQAQASQPGSVSSTSTQTQPAGAVAGAQQGSPSAAAQGTAPAQTQAGSPSSGDPRATDATPVASATGSGQTGAQQSTSQTSSQASSQPAQEQTAARTVPVSSTQSSQSSSDGNSFFSGGIPLPLLIALGILALLLLGLLIFFAVRHLQNSPNRAMAQATVSREDQAKDAELMGNFAEKQRKEARPVLEYPPPTRKPLPKDKIYTEPFESNGGPAMLNLFVADQNTAIGRRNIHAVKSGYSFTVGGGRSDFLIFLVPMPPHIADVTFDGSNCTFIPRKPQYFPDIGSQSVPNCIGKTIRVISDKNYELHIRIERYEDPLTALNKLLHSISVPGEVAKKK